MTEQKPKLLLIEDSVAEVRLFQTLLKQQLGDSITVVVAGSLSEAKDCLLDGRFDLAVLDLELPDCSGVDTLSSFMSACRIPVIIRTSSAKDSLQFQSLIFCADTFIQKSVNDDELVAAIISAIRKSRLNAVYIESLSDRLESLSDVLKTWQGFDPVTLQADVESIKDSIRHARKIGIGFAGTAATATIASIARMIFG